MTFFIGVALTAVWLIGGQGFQKVEVPSVTPSNTFVQSQTNPETEKYAVYSALIKDMYLEYGSNLLVINQDINCLSAPDAIEKEKIEKVQHGMEDYVTRRLPELGPDTIADFDKKRECRSLSRQFDIPAEYVLVSDKEISSLFSKYGIDGWNHFYAKYPGSSGIIGFSDVGFNLEMNQAFVSTSRGCGGICGAGYFVVLKKEQGVWKVQSKEMTWVS
jgi:hypothetical protein